MERKPLHISLPFIGDALAEVAQRLTRAIDETF